ncbi:MAG: hypothetical protein JSU95_08290 [Betaproteobacteria bacterium]|nr:MAG: hypothetical protein JSU95_08290 [Betaproteobacteria bacterium]
MTEKRSFPDLDPPAIAGTTEALHAYAQVFGSYLEALRPWRKHWWHISLRPSLNGMTTGVIHAPIDFELELDPAHSLVYVRTATGVVKGVPLRGQPAAELAGTISDFLASNGIDLSLIPLQEPEEELSTTGYSPDVAAQLAVAWRGVGAAMQAFRSGIREETSPVQLWPHHFDLAMIWLPGEKIPGEDPDDEESSDKQMNFGFLFGDSGIPEPYFYITAYPFPQVFPSLPLPPGATWHTKDFHAAVLLYRDLVNKDDPAAYLLELWNGLLKAGREHLLTK